MSNGSSSPARWTDLLGQIRLVLQAVNNLTTAIQNVFPSSAGTISPSATAGTSGAPPAQVTGYYNVNIGGTAYKIPLYKP